MDDPIKNFHDTPKRYSRFLRAIKVDEYNRVEECLEEIQYIKENLETVLAAVANEASVSELEDTEILLNEFENILNAIEKFGLKETLIKCRGMFVPCFEAEFSVNFRWHHE